MTAANAPTPGETVAASVAAPTEAAVFEDNDEISTVAAMTDECLLLYRHIAALNNRAVAVLHSDRSSALMLFRASLEAARGLPGRHQGDGAGYDGGAVTPEQQPKPHRQMPSFSQPAGAAAEEINSASDPSPSSSLLPPPLLDSVFVQPFQLIPSASAYSHDPLTNVSVAFAIIIFNLAVFFHLQALEASSEQAGGDSDNNLNEQEKQSLILQHSTRAMLLYMKAQFVLHKVGVSMETSCPHGVIDLVTMALLNNLTHVSLSPLCDHEASRHYGAQLLRVCETVILAVQQQQYDAETANILAWYVSSFLIQVHFLTMPIMAPAA